MPTLVHKNHGLYIVRHFYHHNATWQIDRDGVLFLKSRGIGSGQRFGTDLFMQLWMRGMVYTETQLRIPESKPLGGPLSPDDLALRQRAAGLYKALYNGKLEEAYEFIVPPIRGRRTLVQYRVPPPNRG